MAAIFDDVYETSLQKLKTMTVGSDEWKDTIKSIDILGKLDIERTRLVDESCVEDRKLNFEEKKWVEEMKFKKQQTKIENILTGTKIGASVFTTLFIIEVIRSIEANGYISSKIFNILKLPKLF